MPSTKSMTLTVTRAEAEYLRKLRQRKGVPEYIADMAEVVPTALVQDIVKTASRPTSLPVQPAVGGRLPNVGREQPLGSPPGIDLVDRVAKGFEARERAEAEIKAAELADRRAALMARAKAAAVEAEKALSEVKAIEEAIEAEAQALPAADEPVSADEPKPQPVPEASSSESAPSSVSGSETGSSLPMPTGSASKGIRRI